MVRVPKPYRNETLKKVQNFVDCWNRRDWNKFQYALEYRSSGKHPCHPIFFSHIIIKTIFQLETLNINLMYRTFSMLISKLQLHALESAFLLPSQPCSVHSIRTAMCYK